MKLNLLNIEEEKVFDNNYSELLSKLIEFVGQLGDSFNAEKLINIVSSYTVLNFRLNFINTAADVSITK